MSSSRPLDAPVRELIRTRAAVARGDIDLPDDLLLGSAGLGLDSIALVELLLDCDRCFGVQRSVELLDGPPLTIGGLIEHLQTKTGS